MKKIVLVTLTLISVVALLLCGCGNNEQPEDNEANNQVTVTEAPTEAPTPAPTEVPLPEDRAWIDDIYDMLVKDDVDGLQKVLIDSNLAEKAAPYEYKGWSYFENEKGYRLVTTDGKIIGLVLYDENGYFSNSIFYCEDESRDYGFTTIETGDKHFHTYKSTANDQIIYEWYDGKLEYYSDGTVVDPETYGGYLLVWQM